MDSAAAHCHATPADPAWTRLVRLLGVLVLAALALLQLYEVRLRLDFGDFDDLVRTLLARAWTTGPYYMIGDGYWLTLPAIARGAWLALFPADVLQHPLLAVTLMRLVTVACLWGGWRLLVEAVRLLGGGRLAAVLLTAFFLLNGGTFLFAASNLSEPDSLFWTLAALVAVLGGLERGHFSARRACLYGLAMAAACQTRYEAWVFPPLFAALILWHTRRAPRPPALWGGLLLPALPILAWILLSAVRQGNPFHFLVLQKKYVGVYRPSAPLPALIKCFLKIHPLWVPVAGAFGFGELYRQRRRPVARAFAVALLVLLAWAVFRLWTYVMTPRYAWDATLLLAAAGAVGLERFALASARPARRVRRLVLATFLALCLVAYGWGLLRQQPFIPASFRAFAGAVQRQSADGNILYYERLPDGDEYPLHAFRVSVVPERLVLSSWLIGPDGRIPPGQLLSARIRYVLGKSDPLGLAAAPPLLADPDTGWKLWRCRTAP